MRATSIFLFVITMSFVVFTGLALKALDNFEKLLSNGTYENNCPKITKVNKTDFPWNAHDKKIQNNAIQRCATHVRYRDTPCLKYFAKVREQGYHAICGRTKHEEIGH